MGTVLEVVSVRREAHPMTGEPDWNATKLCACGARMIAVNDGVYVPTTPTVVHWKWWCGGCGGGVYGGSWELTKRTSPAPDGSRQRAWQAAQLGLKRGGSHPQGV